MDSPLAYSILDVCEVACVGRTAVYQAINAGDLIARKRGKKTLILDADLKAWLNGLPALAPASKAGGR